MIYSAQKSQIHEHRFVIEEYIPPEDTRVYQSSKAMRRVKKQEQDEAEVTVRCGYLQKKGSGVPYAWRKRWCVLKLSGDFMYYTDDSDSDGNYTIKVYSH